MKLFRKLAILSATATSAIVAIPMMVSAAIPHSTTGVISSCRLNLTGSIRIIDSQAGANCIIGETALSWVNSGGSYIGTSASDNIVTNSSGIVTDGHTANLVATCSTGDVAIGGFTNITGDASLIAAVTGYTSARQGFAQGFGSWVDDAATGITIGADAGVSSETMTIALYPICTTVPSLPS